MYDNRLLVRREGKEGKESGNAAGQGGLCFLLACVILLIFNCGIGD